MHIIDVGNNVRTYVFDDTIVITALINAGKAILIDSGMIEHASQVKSDLESESIQITTIIFTHYHPDHVEGASIFKNIEVICSSKYEENYTYFSQLCEDGIEYKRPTTLVDKGSLVINGFSLEFYKGEGHCACGLMIVINENIICVGDLIMESMNKEPSIPALCSDGNIIQHKESLELILKLKPDNIILGHGLPISGKEQNEKEVRRRLYYLDRVLASDGYIELTQCIEDNPSQWILTNAHDTNLLIFRGEA